MALGGMSNIIRPVPQQAIQSHAPAGLEPGSPFGEAERERPRRSQEQVMKIFLVILKTMFGQNFERREPMPDLKACWEMAQERMAELSAVQHDFKLLRVGCEVDRGDPV